MGQTNYRLGVICSSIAMADSIRRVTGTSVEEVQISMSTGIDEALPIGKEMEKEGIEVIIGRRGTAHLLRETLRIPVLVFQLSSLDIIMSLKEAINYGDVILLPSFRRRLSGLAIFEDIFGIKLIQGVYHDSASLEDLIASSKDQGINAVIGGGVSMRFARKYGVHGVEFQLSDEVVVSTLEDAKSVARSNREEQEKANSYKCIIDATTDGIVAVDAQGRITTINKAARKLLKIHKERTEGSPLTRYLPNAAVNEVLSTETPKNNNLEKINGELFVTSHIPIVNEARLVGAVSTFRHVSNVIRAENEVRRSFAKGLIAKYFLDDFIYSSPLIQEVIHKVKQFAPSDSTVMITGETGTGKEILAHSIHNLSLRQKGPFVSINCAALPDQLLESELFGYEEGAFTGSKRGGKPGLFELAHGGSLFLDEISATPLSVQTRLLRVLQEKEVMRIGGDRLIPIDVRIIAAANRNLQEEVLAGRLREDLFFRLNVLNIYIPPLRARIDDLPVLVDALIRKLSAKYHGPTFSIASSYTRNLMTHSWPGNVRQLENFLEKFLLLSDKKFDPRIFQTLFHELTSAPEAPALRPQEPAVDST
ncbi:MAG: sigma 54-interacting transcriptional regulator, partial [Deltaproteobacteria bacterium]|nr:sigma 54-interacting transcriptional regulator [Deltaproteobacteria bacterium]